MEQIRELIEIAPKKNITQLLKISTARNRPSKLGRLYNLVKKDVLDDEELVRQLYGNQSKNAYAAFRGLKSRLRDLLTTAILNNNAYASSYGTYDEARLNAYQQLNLINLLLTRRAYHTVRHLAVKTLRRVKDFEIIPINSQLYSILASIHLGVGFNQKKFERYQAKAEFYAEAEFVLNGLTSCYRDMRKMIYAHKLLPKEIGERIAKHVQTYEPRVSKYPRSSALQTTFFIMKVQSQTMLGQYQQAIETASTAERVLRACKGAGKNALSLMALTSVECSMKLKDFTQCARQVKQARNYIPKDSINDLKLSEYAVVSGLQTGNYEFAYEELTRINRRRLTRLLKPEHVEYWYILEAYVNLLVVSNRIDVSKTQGNLPKFKLSKFLNNVPSYSKDKQGMNVQILILQVIFFVIQEQYDDVMDRTNALQRYGSRYLRNDENLRNNCFFKLLITAEKNDFHQVATIRKGKKTFQKMISPSAKKLGEANSTELISYEELWEIVLDNLKVPTRGRSVRKADSIA